MAAPNCPRCAFTNLLQSKSCGICGISDNEMILDMSNIEEPSNIKETSNIKNQVEYRRDFKYKSNEIYTTKFSIIDEKYILR